MEKIKYSVDLLRLMTLFESVTGAKLKDCFESNDRLMFIVEFGEIAKAIGKRGTNIERVKNIFKRPIRIVEFNSDLTEFIRNLVYPLKPMNITIEGDVVTIDGGDVKTKGLLIGRNASHLRNIEKIVQRYFEIKEIKVI